MRDGEKKEEREEIRLIVDRINNAWVKGKPDEMAKFFHRDMVIAEPGFSRVGSGRESCVKSYEDFTSAAEVRDFKTSEYMVYTWGETATVSYAFEIDYEMEGKEHHDRGHDLFVFSREGEKWQAVWRTIIPAQEKKPSQ
jgi:hypothetical protein